MAAVIEKGRTESVSKPWATFHEDVAGRLIIEIVDQLAELEDVLGGAGLNPDLQIRTDVLYRQYPVAPVGHITGRFTIETAHLRLAVMDDVKLDVEVCERAAKVTDAMAATLEQAVGELSASPLIRSVAPHLHEGRVRLTSVRPFLLTPYHPQDGHRLNVFAFAVMHALAHVGGALD